MQHPTPTSTRLSATPSPPERVEKIIPDHSDFDLWRAINRVWIAITHLTDRRRDARIYSVPTRDTYYNVLRLI